MKIERHFLVSLKYPHDTQDKPVVAEVKRQLSHAFADGNRHVVTVSALPSHAAKSAKRAKVEGPYPDHVIDAHENAQRMAWLQAHPGLLIRYDGSEPGKSPWVVFEKLGAGDDRWWQPLMRRASYVEALDAARELRP